MDTNQILHHAHQIERLHHEGNYEDVSSLLKDLEHVHITVELLQDTGVAKVLHQVVKTCPMATVKKTAKLLLSKWKKLCSQTQLSTGSCCHRKTDAEYPAQVREGNREWQGGDGSGSCGSSDGPQEESHREVAQHMTWEDAQSVEDSAEGVSVLDRGDFTVASTMPSPVEFTRGLTETSQITTTHMSQSNDASPLRSKCTQLLIQALGSEEASGDGLALDLRELARDIEKHVFMLHGQNALKYKSCVRSKVSNLRNPRSPHLRQGLLKGQLGPEAFARMSAMEMANQELKELRAEYTMSAIREHQRPVGVEGTPTDKVRCRRCDSFDCRVTQISRGALFLPGWVRSGNPDEDTLTFVTCAGCGEQWYHSSWVCL
ncbi:hypothetical protein SKAU_G00250340 [Synaphobranchus kaupii]|uniref:Transcription elongation factor A N-terminal and central domain containing n=1 Tax=Synaphobranchus kaupii TaxID=118154 RepID=A0A9Q1F2P6_SYNKA|nr:hypothetical protein SKAU_G00250340 [Synaphobranchus kaupii]